MKIIKHCSESAPTLVAGQLLGWDFSGNLSITHCFPFPVGSKEGEDEIDTESSTFFSLFLSFLFFLFFLSFLFFLFFFFNFFISWDVGSEYHQNMIRQLNRVDVEDNTVGWYQSAYFGTYIDENAITSQITYQSSISKSVVIFFGKQQQQKKRKKKERKRKK